MARPKGVTVRFTAGIVGLTAAFVLVGCNSKDRDVRHHEQGVIYLSKSGDYDKAIAEFNAALRENPDRPDTLYFLGRAYVLRRKFNEALRTFNALERLAKDDPRVPDGFSEAYLARASRFRLEWADFKGLQDFEPVITDLDAAADYAEKYAQRQPDSAAPIMRQADIEMLRYEFHLARRGFFLRLRQDALDLDRQAQAEEHLRLATQDADAARERFARATDLYEKATVVDRTDVQAYARLIDNATLAGEQDRAETAARRLLAVEPKSEVALLSLSRIAFEKRRPEEAREYAGRVLANDPKNVAANVALAKFAMAEKEYDRSIEYAQRALAVNARDPSALYWRGTAAWAKGDSNLCIASLEPLVRPGVRRDPRLDVDIYLRLAHAYRARGDVQQAIGAFNQVLKREPANALALLGLAELHLSEERPDAARELVGRFDDETSAAQKHYLIGRIYEQESRQRWNEGRDVAARELAQKAAEAYEKAETLDPESPFARLRRTRRLFLSGRFQDCINEADGILEQEQENLDVRYFKARAETSLGRLSDAVRTAQENLAIRPAHAPTHMLIIDTYVRYGRPDLAIRQAEAAAAIIPQSNPIERRLSTLYHERSQRGDRYDTDDLNRCLASAKRVLDRSPDDLPMLLLCASAYRRLDRQKEADQVLERTSEAYPKNATLLFVRGEAAMLRGNLPRARELYQAALAADGQHTASFYPLGMVLVAEGRHDEAAEHFKPATATPQRQVSGIVGLIVALQMAEKPAQAADVAARAIEALGASEPLEGTQVMLLMGLNRQAEARAALASMVDRHARVGAPIDSHVVRHIEALLDALKADPERARLVARQANLTTFFILGRWHAQAIAAARRALELVPESVNRMNALLTCLTLAGADYRAEALAVAQKIVAADPEWSGGHSALAAQYEINQDDEQAERALARAVELDPKNIALRFRLGIFHERRKQPQKALAVYRAAAEIEDIESNAVMAYQVYNNLAYIMATAGDDVPGAMTVVDKARAIVEKNPALMNQPRLQGSVLDTMGWIEHLAGKHAQAVQTLERANALMPFNAVLAYHLGAAYVAVGEQDKAKRCLAACIDLAPKEGFEGMNEAKRLLASIGT